jgi:hypothetical protein
VTEEQWLHSTEPEALLDFVSGRATDRKLRLLACGWFRLRWGLFPDRRVRRLIKLAELYADGLIGDSKFIGTSWLDHGPHSPPVRRASSVRWTARGIDVARQALTAVLRAPSGPSDRRDFAALFRCVFAPFHAGTSDPAHLTPSVVSLSRTAYDERSPAGGVLDPLRLAMLADALEEAGCTDEAILSHLRSPGPHVRGCWALDLILGRS